MSVAGYLDAPLDQFGGLVTDMPPADLPLGVSPDCADVAFVPGAVRTRPGLLSFFTAISGNPTVNYLRTFINSAEQQILLALDSAGFLWAEFTAGALTQIASGLAQSALAKSCTQFGREYIAISDGKSGVDIPRQYDSTNFDRVSQCGPGAGPSITEAPVEASIAIAASPTGAVRANNISTITTTSPHNYQIGQTVLIVNVADATFNGTFLITAIPGATQFTYDNPGANSASGNTGSGASSTLQPQVSPGVHQVSVIFQTRQGYLTAPSPPVAWSTGGGRRAALTNIPLGSANVIARIIAFTGANGANFFYVPTNVPQSTAMLIPDNATTSLTVDFSDAALLAGANVDNLFNLLELGECAGAIDYASRNFWWGERAKIDNFLNLTFDGGFDPTGTVPLGWAADATLGPGGSEETSQTVWGFAYRIHGPIPSGPSTRGMITQSAYRDVDSVPILQPNTKYSVRLRAARGSSLGAATLTIDIFSATDGGVLASANISSAALTAAYQEFIVAFSAPTPAAIPADAVLRLYANFEDAPAPSESLVVDCIEIFATQLPVNLSQIRASYSDDPESYDGITGILSVAESNGQAVRAAFALRGQLYFVKERSFFVTQDDGVNEPDKWSIAEVSNKVGTPSVHGVDVGEDWAVIAAREGLYLYYGSEPVKISQEIQPTWDLINWQYGHTLWVRVDTRNKRILCGVPLGATATQPNAVLMMDYRGIASAEAIAAAAPVQFSSLTKKNFVFGSARKWSPWTIAARAATLAERPDGTAQVFFGNAAANGKIYQLGGGAAGDGLPGDGQLTDDGAAISSYYTTAFLLPADIEADMQLRAHRKLFAYLTANAEGAGLLGVTAFANNEAFALVLQPLALSNPAPKDLELPINVTAERVAFQIGWPPAGAPPAIPAAPAEPGGISASAGNWFRLRRLVPSLTQDPWAPVRGGN
ncbi:MAG: hypothetical protein WAM91_14450 [Candidatus Acidiferrales bacterium]